MSAEIVAAAPSVIDRAAEIMQRAFRPEFMWSGTSGRVTGEGTAQHLESVTALLEREGWLRDWGSDGGPKDPGVPDEKAPTRDLIRYLITLAIRVLRYEYFEGPQGLLLSQAMNRGDEDVSSAAQRCMDLVLRARTGDPSASYFSWSRRDGRTFDEVRGLLAEGAEFARRYGPGVES